MEKTYYGIKDIANNVLLKYYVFETEKEAKTACDDLNAIPPVKRLRKREKPCYAVVGLVDDGLQQMYVGMTKHFKEKNNT